MTELCCVLMCVSVDLCVDVLFVFSDEDDVSNHIERRLTQFTEREHSKLI